MRTPPGPVIAADGAGERGDPEPTYPYPPRYWWMKRLVPAGAVALIALAGLRFWWGWKAHQLLHAYLDPLKARGEPVAVADLNPPDDVPPSDNAALPLMQAAGLVNPANSGPANSPVTFPNAWPFDAAWNQLAEQAVAAHPKVFPLVRQARSRSRADFGIRGRTPAVSILLPHLNAARMLANLVGDAALRAHFKGDDAAAVETIRDVRAMGPPVEQPAALVSHLVRIGIDALALYKIQAMAPELNVGPEGEPDDPAAPAVLPAAGSGPPRPARRAQVRALIRELLDDADRGDEMHRAVGTERVFEIDTTQWATRELPLARPVFDLDVLRMARRGDAIAQASAAPDWPAADAILARPPAGPPAPSPAAMMGQILSFSGDRAVLQEFRIRAERRMAAVALAVRLYRLDHAGQWPASLQALVPAYLPAVPTDPFAPGNRPLGYVILKGALPDGSDRPLVYSVDENGTDDTAGKTPPPVPPAPCFGRTNKTPDQWRDLKRWQPPTTTTQPSTNGP